MTACYDELLEKARLKLVQTIGEIPEDTDLFSVVTHAEVRIRRLQAELDDQNWFVARLYSHTDRRLLWSIVSRPMKSKHDAEVWADFMH